MQNRFVRPFAIPLNALLSGMVGFTVVTSSTRALAVTRVWSASGSGNWTTGSNWTPNGAPQHGDDVFLTSVAPTNKTITYQNATLILHEFNSVLIDHSGVGTVALVQNGTFTPLYASTLTIGNVGSVSYTLNQGQGVFGATSINGTSTLTVGSAGFFQSSVFNHNGGNVLGPGTIHVPNRYNYHGGVMSARLEVGTFVASTGGTFTGHIDVGTMLSLEGNPRFHGGLTNRTTYLQPFGQEMHVRKSIAQYGGVFTQWGSVDGKPPGTSSSDEADVIIGGGAHWDQQRGLLRGQSLLVAAGQAGAATYTLGGIGSANFDNVGIGLVSDGTVIHNNGRLLSTGNLTVGGFSGFIRGGEPEPGKRGFYLLSSGTVQTNQLVVAAHEAISGLYRQDGGATNIAGLLTIDASSTSSGTVSISAGNFQVAGTTTNNGSFIMSGGTAQLIGNVNGAGTVTVGGGATLRTSRIRQRHVALSGNGQILMIGGLPDGAPTNRVKSLDIQEAGGTVMGTLDLNGSRLAIDYDGASPAQNIRRYLHSGRAGGAWNGAGLRSIALNPDGEDRFGLGYNESLDVFGAAGGVFHGLFVDSSALLIGETLYGDADLDGDVDGIDVGRWAQNFTGDLGGAGSKHWFEGDWDYDGDVDGIDVGKWAQNFTGELGGALSDVTVNWPANPHAAALLQSLGVTLIPEPASYCAGLIGAAMLRRRSRRSACHSAQQRTLHARSFTSLPAEPAPPTR